jgi:hypothetical protein
MYGSLIRRGHLCHVPFLVKLHPLLVIACGTPVARKCMQNACKMSPPYTMYNHRLYSVPQRKTHRGESVPSERSCSSCI